MRSVSITVCVLGLLLITATLAGFEQHTAAMAGPRSIIYDTRFVEAMSNVSRLLPDDANLVVSSNGAIVTYFTGHIATVPWSATSEQALILYMRQGGYLFLLAFENKTDVPELKAVFSSRGLKALESTFVQLAEYHTDFYVLHLYQLKPA
jgi:hypothetical protein